MCDGCRRDSHIHRMECFSCGLCSYDLCDNCFGKPREEVEWNARQERERLRAEAEAEAKQEAKRREHVRAAREQAKREDADRRVMDQAIRKLKEESERQERRERREAELEAKRAAREEARQKLLNHATCPAGHSLLALTVQAGFPCDVCGEEAREGATMWCCRTRDDRGTRTCDHDICNSCRLAAAKRTQKEPGNSLKKESADYKAREDAERKAREEERRSS